MAARDNIVDVEDGASRGTSLEKRITKDTEGMDSYDPSPLPVKTSKKLNENQT